MGNFVDHSGKRFGRLLVLRRGEKNIKGHCYRWACQCDCGVIKAINSTNLQMGKTRSCGCLAAEVKLVAKRTHGHSSGRTNGSQVSRTYTSWCAMKTRCYHPGAINFDIYGARGITVCERWLNSFEAFLEDMGERPPGKSLERIKNDGNYEPENCKWATRKEQNNNTRTNRVLELNGVSKTMSAWAEELGMLVGTLWARLKKGWTVERAITQPLRGTK